MGSLRPEDLTRKIEALRASNGGRAVSDQPPDDTEVVCYLGGSFDTGDWVIVANTAAGHLVVSDPVSDGDPSWVGVVSQKGSTGDWGRVKTCGVTYAKVTDPDSLSAGDSLVLRPGSNAADGLEEDEDPGLGSVCGRFLAKIGDGTLSWVHIGSTGAGGDPILIHHHNTSKNSRWFDMTSASVFTGYSWHLFKVQRLGFTDGPNRLMLAIGGGTTHGEDNLEGYAWGGVIGTSGSMGMGQLGGNASSGRQGVLGAEAPNDGTDIFRVNIRSWAGVNCYDRYSSRAQPRPDGIGPIRYTHPDNYPAMVWQADPECDRDPPNCPSGVLWWSGAMLYNRSIVTTGSNTNWPGQWCPALTVERNCCDIQGVFTPEDHDGCDVVANPNQFSANANDLVGAYENLIPYGYMPTTGRLDELGAICCLVRHVRAIWAFLDGYTAAMENALTCIDTKFGTKLDGSGTPGVCCAAAGQVTVAAIDCGPPSSLPC